jgi:hypothetical protein
MGAAPSSNVTAPGLVNSAPQFTVNRLSKGDRLPMTRNPAVRHDPNPAVRHDTRRLSRLLDNDFPSNWHWS